MGKLIKLPPQSQETNLVEMPTWPTARRQVGVQGHLGNYKGLGIVPEGAVEQVKCRLPAEVRNTRVGMNPNIPSNQLLLGILDMRNYSRYIN
jgi:hypothetical protein